LLLIAHPGDDLWCEDEAGVKATGLLDPACHAGTRRKRGELIDDQHAEPLM
jgi:hypothetical protein